MGRLGKGLHAQEQLFNEYLPLCRSGIGQLCNHGLQITPRRDDGQLEENALDDAVFGLFVLGNATLLNAGVGNRNWNQNIEDWISSSDGIDERLLRQR